MENKLPVEFKTKWLEALRSGEYKQAQETLCAPLYGEYDEDIDDYTFLGTGYCCLGVAADICGLNMEVYGDQPMLSDVVEQDSKILSELGIPEMLCQPFRSGPGYGTITIAGQLAKMNDEGDTFEEIAQYIEENL